ncbi:hypothetical protein BD289DRAFT_85521 [Coniella lustricola]|uniref:Uncharacterized protein n=1 Tax=Coniella lustricola TaxID=2025994 RepID=A0A2T2ZYX6_9PEZI|nr:hypothetical protein BD289DRAFT_85521 [Coniella lustricola]
MATANILLQVPWVSTVSRAAPSVPLRDKSLVLLGIFISPTMLLLSPAQDMPDDLLLGMYDRYTTCSLVSVYAVRTRVC